MEKENVEKKIGRPKIEEGDKKVCTKCKEEKLITEFYKNKHGSHFAECKECNKNRMKTRYKKDPAKIKRINDAWLAKLTEEEYQQFREKVNSKRRK